MSGQVVLSLLIVLVLVGALLLYLGSDEQRDTTESGSLFWHVVAFLVGFALGWCLYARMH